MHKPSSSMTTPIRMSERVDSSAENRAEKRMDEFDDLVELLLAYSADSSPTALEMATFIANACMGDNHLWQDMQLADRGELSVLMQMHYPTLAAKNTGDMKWKKFFYKQLCEREDIMICKSPSCAICTDYHHCFGPEDAAS